MPKEGKVLNRTIRATGEGFELEADPRHAELLGSATGLENSSISTPCDKEDEDLEYGTDEHEHDNLGLPHLDYEERLALAIQELHPEPRVPRWSLRVRNVDGAEYTP